MGFNYLSSLSHFIPELLVSITMMVVILLEASYRGEKEERTLIYVATFLGLLAAMMVSAGALSEEAKFIFTKSLVIDKFATLSKMIMIFGTAIMIYLARESKDIYQDLKGEFSAIALGVLVGGMLLASANNMLTTYIGIETLSILSYALASLKKREQHSAEAGLKYALYGGVCAAVMLFGMSHIFGVLGTIYFSEMPAAMAKLSNVQISILLPSFLFLFVGIGYKIAAAPFHMWSPDVYQGSPIPVTAFFAIVPKLAGLAILIRISHLLFSANSGVFHISWVGILSVIAAVTMTVGNVSAIGQKSIKRMLAYSSIAHVGMMLLGVLVVNEAGVRAVLFYAIAYLFMTAVAFYAVSFVQDKYQNDHFERFSGMIHRYPLMAIAVVLIMFSLAGIPPFAGFVAKFHLLSLIVKKQFYVLAVIAGINSVVAIYYYLKIVKIMIFRPVESNETLTGFGMVNQSLIMAFTIPVVLLGIFWEKMMSFVGGAKIFIQ